MKNIHKSLENLAKSFDKVSGFLGAGITQIKNKNALLLIVNKSFNHEVPKEFEGFEVVVSVTDKIEAE